MKVLVVAQDVPFPPIGGGSLRTFHLLRALASRHDVTLVAPDVRPPEERNQPPFAVNTISVEWQPARLYSEMHGSDSLISQRAYEVLADPDHEPWIASSYQSDAMDAALSELDMRSFDVALFEQSVTARYADLLPAHVPWIVDFHDVLSATARRTAERTPEPDSEREMAEAERVLRYERDLADRCALGIVVSDEEATSARELLGLTRVAVVPNGVDTAYFQPGASHDEPDVLFTGLMHYPPNADAVAHFVQDIWPKVMREIPRARFHVVGARPPAEMLELATPNVLIHGRVEDVRPFYRDASVVVVPLRHGGGTRLKILEAAASGKAIVSTTLGAAGLDFERGAEIVIADSPHEFADAVAQLCRDPNLRSLLGARARARSLRYDWSHAASTFLSAIEAVGERASAATPVR